MSHEANLIVDVGMHNGDDTAYYLHKGFRVVAVEANPVLVNAARERFAAEIQAQRLEILPVGIAARAGEADFFISESLDVWSSFDRDVATRTGQACRTVKVPCMTFGEVIDQHGVPYYAKIDIEGGERDCIDSLTPDRCPPYLSIEMHHEVGDQDIRSLESLGYTRYRCIRQNDFAPIHPGNIATELRLRRWRAGPLPLALAMRALFRARQTVRPAIDPGWTFGSGSSGTFGEQWSGPWMTTQEMLAIWQRLHDIDIELAQAGIGQWFDVHAAK